MKYYKITSAQISLMMFTEQKIDKPSMQKKIYENFPELLGTPFKPIIDIPDPRIPIIEIESSNIKLVISKNNYSLLSKNNEGYTDKKILISKIKDNLDKLYNCVQSTMTGPYRIGIVARGKFANKKYFLDFLSENNLSSIYTDKSAEIIYSCREIMPNRDMTLENGKSLPLKINQWKRYKYDFDGGESAIEIDTNTHSQTPLQIQEITPPKIFNIFKHCLEEAFNGAE